MANQHAQTFLEKQLEAEKFPSPKEKRKLRDINITQAMTYPLLPRNFVNTLLVPIVPGLLGAAVCVLALLLWTVYTSQPNPFENRDSLCFFGMACLLFLASLLGYGWRLLGVLRQSGYSAPAPDWTLEKMIGSWWDGTKLMLMILIPICLFLVPGVLIDKSSYEQAMQSTARTSHLQIEQFKAAYRKSHPNCTEMDMYIDEPLPLADPKPTIWATTAGLVTSFLFMPFLFGSIVQSADNRRLFQLLNIRRTVAAGTRCFGKSLLVSFASISVLLAALACLMNWIYVHDDAVQHLPWARVFSMLAFCVTSMSLTGFHLVAQAFDDYRD